MSRRSRPVQGDSLAGFRPPRSREEEEEAANVPTALLKQARKSGQLDLSGRKLQLVPPEVYRLDVDAPPESRHDISFNASERWWEHNELTKLLLSSNQITKLDDDISLLPALLTLDLHDNQLSSVPATLGELQQLRVLRLSHNQLKLLPLPVFQLSSLQSLSLQKNQLASLPEQIANLTRLTHLDMSDNFLVALPPLAGLENLVDLRLSANRLVHLPPGMELLPRLRSLDCSRNFLEELPFGLSSLSNLEQLHLRHNKLRLLPKLLPPNLKELYLGNNLLQTEGAEPACVPTHLSVLELRDNQLASVPTGAAAMLALTRLDLANNDITTLSPEIGLLPKLAVLQLEGNPLRGLRRDMLTKGTAELLKYLRGRIQQPSNVTLPSNEQRLSDNLRNLRLLEYSDRKSSSVPDEILDQAEKFTVTKMNLSKNLLEHLPDRMCVFTSVCDVDLSFNLLSSLPLVLCRLTQLTHLDLRKNQLSFLPSDLKNLNKLISINLQFNRFSGSPPEVLFLLPSLEVLLLGNNQLQDLDPEPLRNLLHLHTLDLSNNCLDRLRPQLGLCTGLRWLLLDGNQFRSPRSDVLAKGTNAVLDFLRSRIPEGQPPR